MAWADPTTIVYNQLLDVATLNQYMVDNPLALKNPPTDLDQNWNTTINTTSTSFVDITGADVTITTTGGRIMIGFHTPHTASGGSTTYFTITIDGVEVSGHANGVALVTSGGTSQMSFVYLTAALAAGAHTVKIRWRVDSGARTATINKFQLWAREA